jgi:hydroxymethylglutaryl-CoA reductase
MHELNQSHFATTGANKSFSKLTKLEKLEAVLARLPGKNEESEVLKKLLQSFWHQDSDVQKIFDEFSENTLSNFYFPFGVIPDFRLNSKDYIVPMVIEESSVVAAASRSAKFWRDRGGFKAQVIATKKVGQVHFQWNGTAGEIFSFFEQYKNQLLEEIHPLEENMRKRGGGILSLELRDKTAMESGYFQLYAEFETCDAMGANFINTILEGLGRKLRFLVEANEEFFQTPRPKLEVIMAILSNYTPECMVRAWVDCPIAELEDSSLGMTAESFAQKFDRAMTIARIDVNRAVTHNKGIFNGIDAVVIATGNDFRAVEACGHAFAAKSGQYQSLTRARISDNHFHFELEIPLALGTVGGLTSLHPLSKLSLVLLGRPAARELMEVVAAVGLAQNFGAVRSLVTTGIQQGHMKMHLINILKHLEASAEETEKTKNYFADKTVSFKAVRDYLATLRVYQ